MASFTDGVVLVVECPVEEAPSIGYGLGWESTDPGSTGFVEFMSCMKIETYADGKRARVTFGIDDPDSWRIITETDA
jgi:hypothetical protein